MGEEFILLLKPVTGAGASFPSLLMSHYIHDLYIDCASLKLQIAQYSLIKYSKQ